MACIAAFIVGFALVAVAGCATIGTPIQARLPHPSTPTTIYQGNVDAIVTCHVHGTTFQTDVQTAINNGLWPKYCKLA